MKIFVTGAVKVRKDQYNTLSSGNTYKKIKEAYKLPYLKKIFDKKSLRFGRFDKYTRIGCTAVGLALWEAGLTSDGLKNIGFILASHYGSFVTDLAFYKTTANGGLFASPNLFSYTLPNIVIGECALQFGLMGPSFCLGSDGECAHEALYQAALCLENNTVNTMLVGWLDVLPEQAQPKDEGAIVLVFEKQNKQKKKLLELEYDSRQGLRFSNGETINSIDQLFRSLRSQYPNNKLEKH